LVSILLMLAILIGLSLKAVEGKVTRSAFLAILYALAIITVIARHLFSYSISRLFLLNPSFTLFRWDAIFFLIIPLVFVAWQYSMKEVVIYCLAVMFIEEIPILFQSADAAPVVQSSQLRTPTFPPMSDRYMVISSSRDFRVLSILSNTLGSIARSGIFIIVGWIENRLVNLQRSQHLELEQANTKLRKFAVTNEKLAQTQERNRIARELHDTLAHTLSSVSVQLEATKALFERNPKEAQKILAQTIENTKNGLTETRRALVDLRASELESYGLTGAIRNLVQSAAERGGFKADFHLDQQMDTLPEDLAHCLYRVTQEAAENILRHAGAEQVEVSLLSEGNSVILAIRDDGSGFDMNGLESRHLGVRGMRERVEMLGGELSVNSALNQGTEVKAVIDRAGI
jgi:signal transduction histidine kinase